jgi:hypothetical protein
MFVSDWHWQLRTALFALASLKSRVVFLSSRFLSPARDVGTTQVLRRCCTFPKNRGSIF